MRYRIDFEEAQTLWGDPNLVRFPIDYGGDITPFIVEESVTFPNRDDKARKVNISMPEWMIDELDATARHFATTRQGVINMWIGERLETERRKAKAI